MQVQINVLDPSVLIEARNNPSLYPNLLVRVSGYSAYFNDLSPAMKDEIIRRSTLAGR
jgi:formate C-acetyltransferase